MNFTEQHVIKRHDPRYGVIDAAAFASKNLYNQEDKPRGTHEQKQGSKRAGKGQRRFFPVRQEYT